MSVSHTHDYLIRRPTNSVDEENVNETNPIRYMYVVFARTSPGTVSGELLHRAWERHPHFQHHKWAAAFWVSSTAERASEPPRSSLDRAARGDIGDTVVHGDRHPLSICARMESAASAHRPWLALIAGDTKSSIISSSFSTRAWNVFVLTSLSVRTEFNRGRQ